MKCDHWWQPLNTPELKCDFADEDETIDQSWELKLQEQN